MYKSRALWKTYDDGRYLWVVFKSIYSQIVYDRYYAEFGQETSSFIEIINDEINFNVVVWLKFQ